MKHLALALVLVAPTTGLGQATKTIRVDGTDIKLEVVRNLYAVSSIKDDGSWEGFVAESVRSQFTDKTPGQVASAIALSHSKTAKFVEDIGVGFVPILTGVDDGTQLLNETVARTPGASVVYRYKNRLVVPLGTLTVEFAQDPTEQDLAAVRRHGFEVLDEDQYDAKIRRFRAVEKAEPFTAAETLEKLESVNLAAADLAYELEAMTTDPLEIQQWYLNRESIDLPGALALKPKEPVLVALLDDGVDRGHPDLAGVVDAGKDFFNIKKPDASPFPGDSHGTACAGLISAVGSNGLGIRGISPLARILPLRICGRSPRSRRRKFSTGPAVSQAIRYALSSKADVISMSVALVPDPFVTKEIKRAAAQGALIIAATGNAFPACEVLYPSKLPECLSVGAWNRAKNRKWYYSCYTAKHFEVDLVAPSGNLDLLGDIVTTDFSGARGYESGDYVHRFGGTSAAAPIVAGVASLVLSSYPQLKGRPELLRKVLLNSARRVGIEEEWEGSRSYHYGAGLVNARRALQQASRMVASLPRDLPKQFRIARIARPLTISKEGAKLTPNRRWLATLVSPRAIASNQELRDFTDTVAVVGDREVVLFEEKSSQKVARALDRAGASVPVFPVFDYKSRLAVPLGTITIQVDGMNVERVEDISETIGWKILEKGDANVFRVYATDGDSLDLVNALRRLSIAQGVVMASPDFATSQRNRK